MKIMQQKNLHGLKGPLAHCLLYDVFSTVCLLLNKAILKIWPCFKNSAIKPKNKIVTLCCLITDFF